MQETVLRGHIGVMDAFFLFAAVGFKHVSATGTGFFSFEPIIFLFRAIQECAVGKPGLFCSSTVTVENFLAWYLWT